MQDRPKEWVTGSKIGCQKIKKEKNSFGFLASRLVYDKGVRPNYRDGGKPVMAKWRGMLGGQ